MTHSTLPKTRRPAVFVFAIFFILLSACAPASPTATQAPAAPSTTLTVLAASSLTAAFEELGAQFEADHPDVQLAFNFAGSQQLTQQLAQGAPADVFASANQKQMDAAIEAGRVGEGAEVTFARNRLVVIYPAENPAGLERLSDLAEPGLKLVLAAVEAPAGQYSLDVLDKAAADGSFGVGYRDRVLANVVSYESNVKSVLTKVTLGEADAGIVYTSDLSGAAPVGRLEIPDALNVIAEYPIALVQDAPQPDLAQAFIDLLLSPEGQAVLERHGLMTP